MSARVKQNPHQMPDIRLHAIQNSHNYRSGFLPLGGVEFFANLPPCLIGMEACSGAHHWARQLHSLGHDVRIIALRFVIPY